MINALLLLCLANQPCTTETAAAAAPILMAADACKAQEGHALVGRADGPLVDHIIVILCGGRV